MAIAKQDRITAAERAFAARYPRFYAALMALGATNEARAVALDLSPRQFHDVKQGVVSIKVSRMEQYPELVRAWYEDVTALHGASLAA